MEQTWTRLMMCDWEDTSFGAIADFINGYAFKPGDWSRFGLPIVRIEQMLNPAADSDGYEGQLPNQFRVDNGSLLFSWSATLATVIWDRGPAWLNQHLFRVVPKEENRVRFLHHLIDFHLERLANQSHGTTMRHIKRADLLPYRVKIPKPAEQTRIAAVLDTVDEAIAKTEAVIAKLKQVRAGLLHDLLTRGLDENGRLRDPVAHPEQFQDSPLGRIPREWTVLSLEALLARVPNPLRSGPFGSALLKQELKDSGVPLLGIDNVHVERFVAEYRRFVDDEKFIELKRYSVRPLDVMITIMGTVGRCCVVPESIDKALSSKHVWTITFDRQCYSPNLACWQMNYAPWILKQLRRDEQGGVMTAIRSETLRGLLFPVPPYPEVCKIESLFHEITKQIVAEEALLPKLFALKSGLMDGLLTGRVRVSEEISIDSRCP